MHDHLQGKKHAKTIKFGPRQTIPCHVCGLDFTYPVQLLDHINGHKHKERAFFLLGFPMLMCHLCDKIVTGNRDEHIAGQRHTANLAHVGAQAEELPWVRVSRYLTNPTAEQEAQIHRSDMEGTFRELHHVFGDLWTPDDVGPLLMSLGKSRTSHSLSASLLRLPWRLLHLPTCLMRRCSTMTPREMKCPMLLLSALDLNATRR